MISKDDVIKVADLARLELTEKEIEKYEKDLQQILQAVNKLQEVDTTGIEPTAHSIRTENVMRDDEVGESLSRDKAIQNGPEVADGYFRVPRILENE